MLLVVRRCRFVCCVLVVVVTCGCVLFVGCWLFGVCRLLCVVCCCVVACCCLLDVACDGYCLLFGVYCSLKIVRWLLLHGVVCWLLLFVMRRSVPLVVAQVCVVC